MDDLIPIGKCPCKCHPPERIDGCDLCYASDFHHPYRKQQALTTKKEYAIILFTATMLDENKKVIGRLENIQVVPARSKKDFTGTKIKVNRIMHTDGAKGKLQLIYEIDL